ncbi:hypothetical protein [Coleofasciculus sp. A1-SPW-01]
MSRMTAEFKPSWETPPLLPETDLGEMVSRKRVSAIAAWQMC